MPMRPITAWLNNMRWSQWTYLHMLQHTQEYASSSYCQEASALDMKTTRRSDQLCVKQAMQTCKLFDASSWRKQTPTNMQLMYNCRGVTHESERNTFNRIKAPKLPTGTQPKPSTDTPWLLRPDISPSSSACNTHHAYPVKANDLHRPLKHPNQGLD